MRYIRKHMVLLFLLFLAPWVTAGTGEAATCSVPSVSYSSIQDAVNNASCTTVVVAAGVYNEKVSISRSLTITGAGSSSTTIDGRVVVVGGTVQLNSMQVGGTATPPFGRRKAALRVKDGSQVSGTDLVVLKAQSAPCFSDGFESGDTSAWSVTVS